MEQQWCWCRRGGESVCGMLGVGREPLIRGVLTWKRLIRRVACAPATCKKSRARAILLKCGCAYNIYMQPKLQPSFIMCRRRCIDIYVPIVIIYAATARATALSLVVGGVVRWIWSERKMQRRSVTNAGTEVLTRACCTCAPYKR